jgi:gliding motility-associated-like protein
MKALFQFLFILISPFWCINGIAQDCPENIDFETGTFQNWTCYAGVTTAVGDQNVISLTPSGGPIPGKHTIFSRTANFGELDPLGGFPVVCPNGSGYSIRLGNEEAGGQAEGVSYEFTIPPTEDNFSLIYHYAVVFQSPNHKVNEQPRMEIEVTNVTDNTIIDCSSFTFIAMGSSMPGFKSSIATDTITVLYKDWSAVSVDLSGKAGKRIRLFFKTADCTFRRHFGYAYIDVNSECTNNFIGSSFCPDDAFVNVTAPFGYQSYVWKDENLTQVLGNEQTLTLTPPPASGTRVAVEVTPYDGYGCPTTLFTQLKDNLVVTASAGKDALSCNNQRVELGAAPKPGLVYQWSPANGLTDPKIANPFAAPDVTTNYVLTVSNSGGGCKTTDAVVVRASVIDSSMGLAGKDIFCIDNGDSAVLSVQPTSNILWYKDNVAISGATAPVYKVNTSGTYHAILRNSMGCIARTESKPIVIDKAKPGITYPVTYAVIDLPLSLKARNIGETALWDPGVNLNNVQSYTPVYTGSKETSYTITLTTNTGCITVDTQLVKLVKNVEIYVPNAFTPNGDGKNDYLRPHLRGIKDLRYFKVFNRWGQLLFEKRNVDLGWDGSIRGMPQQSQTVVWILEGVGVDNVIYTKKGVSTLIR